MLTALFLTEAPERGALSRCWRRIFPAPVTAGMDSAACRPFVRITCEKRAGREPDWRMVAAYCLDSAGRILLPPGTDPPRQSGLRRFVPTRYCRRMMENLALDILVCSGLPASEKRVALYGREPEIRELLPRIAPLAGSIHIISRRASMLEKPVSELMASTGMCVTLSDEMSAAGCRMLLAPSGGAGVISADGGTMVLSPDKPFSGGIIHVSAALPQLHPELEELGGLFDTLELCGAFYEIAGADFLGRASPRCGIINGAEAAPDEMAELLSGT